MNLINDFLFTSMMSYPEICERFSQILVKIILNYDVKNIRVIPQKVFYGSNTNTHGIRLDVYIEEDSDELKVSEESLFDIETEKKNDKTMVEAVKKDEEVSKDYMKIYEKEQMLWRLGKEEEMINSVESLM